MFYCCVVVLVVNGFSCRFLLDSAIDDKLIRCIAYLQVKFPKLIAGVYVAGEATGLPANNPKKEVVMWSGYVRWLCNKHEKNEI